MMRATSIILVLVLVGTAYGASDNAKFRAEFTKHRERGNKHLNPTNGAPAGAPAAQPPAAAAGNNAPQFVQRPGATYRRLEPARFSPPGYKPREPKVSASFLARIVAGVKNKIAKSGKIISHDKQTNYLWEATYTPATLEWGRGANAEPKRATRADGGGALVALETEAQVNTGTSSDAVFGQGAVWRQVTEATDVDDPIPFDATGRLSNGCSGTLISSRLYITAGHCLINVTSRAIEPYANLAFSPAQRTATVKPYGTFNAIGWWIDGDYYATSTPDPENDWAVVLLDREVRTPAGAAPGWYGMKKEVYGDVRISGFPAVTKSGTDLWTDTCTLEDKWFMVSSTHTCDTEPGNSGSGVAMLDAANKKYLIAVHSSGGSSSNWACSFEGEIFDQLLAIKRQYP